MTQPGEQHHEDVTFRVLTLLFERPTVTQRDIARQIGFSLGSANKCIRLLAKKGLIDATHDAAGHKSHAANYVLTDEGLAARTAMKARYLERRLRDYDRLKSEIDGLRGD